jgi:hypothetical protein
MARHFRGNNFTMVARAHLGHKGGMADTPFSIKVSLDPLKELVRYRWTISEGEEILQVSKHTYGTEIQTHAAATVALKRTHEQRRRPIKFPSGKT